MKDVYVVARVFDLDAEKPKHAWFPDFMQRYVEGNLYLNALHGLEGRVARRAKESS